MLKNIPLEKRHLLTKEDSIKGGSVKSISKTVASKLRALCKKGLSKENANRLFEIILYRDISALEILILILSMEKSAVSINDKMRLIKLRLKWHIAHHGIKYRIVGVPEQEFIRSARVNMIYLEENNLRRIDKS